MNTAKTSSYNLTTTKNVISAVWRFEIKSGRYVLDFTQSKEYKFHFSFVFFSSIDGTPGTWWSCMINDNTHKNSLSNTALELFSITPHSVMPERLVSILDWQQYTKRRNYLNPFTLEAIAKI